MRFIRGTCRPILYSKGNFKGDAFDTTPCSTADLNKIEVEEGGFERWRVVGGKVLPNPLLIVVFILIQLSKTSSEDSIKPSVMTPLVRQYLEVAQHKQQRHCSRRHLKHRQ